MATPKKQRIVIYRLGSLGDTVVALPCFHKIAQTWPEAERVVLTNFPVSSKAAPLEIILRESGLIDAAIAYPVGTRSIGELWRLVLRLRRLHADALVYLTAPRGLTNAWRDWLFFKLCGFKKIVGAPLVPDLQLRRMQSSASPGEPDAEERECERLARCLLPLGPINLDDAAAWDLRLTDREIKVGTEVSEPLSSTPYFAINMGGKVQENDWGLTNWRAFIGALSAEYPTAGLLVVGGAEDSERAQHVMKAWTGPAVDACGRLSPRESAAAMRNASAFIGHDSGPLHLAAATGVRCVGLFGNHNPPKRWHPRGAQHRPIHRMAGVHTITIREVVDALGDTLMSDRSSAAIQQGRQRSALW